MFSRSEVMEGDRLQYDLRRHVTVKVTARDLETIYLHTNLLGIGLVDYYRIAMARP